MKYSHDRRRLLLQYRKWSHKSAEITCTLRINLRVYVTPANYTHIEFTAAFCTVVSAFYFGVHTPHLLYMYM